MVHAVLSETQTESVDTEVSNLLRKQAIEACDHEAGEYISPIFTRPKKDGSHRMILNLKFLKKNITHHHFKIFFFCILLKKKIKKLKKIKNKNMK